VIPLPTVRAGDHALNSAFSEGTLQFFQIHSTVNLTKGEITMANPICWETSLTAAKAKAKKEKKLILMDYYNNL
jgi:hypothetical protein